MEKLSVAVWVISFYFIFYLPYKMLSVRCSVPTFYIMQNWFYFSMYRYIIVVIGSIH